MHHAQTRKPTAIERQNHVDGAGGWDIGVCIEELTQNENIVLEFNEVHLLSNDNG